MSLILINPYVFSAAADIVTTDLKLNLDVGNASSYPGSGTTWTDLSGNGINGTLNGVEYNSDNGGSLVFDGISDYVTTSSSQLQPGNNPFTMEVWFRWFGNGTNAANILFTYGNDIGANRNPVLIINSSNGIDFSLGGSGLVSSSTIQTNTWYQVVSTYRNVQFDSKTQIYLNGSLQNTTSYNSANIELSGSNGETAGIGCLFSQYGNIGTGATKRYGTFNGNISVIRFYKKALSASECTQNFNAIRSRYGL